MERCCSNKLAAWFDVAGLMASELLAGPEAEVFFQHFIMLYLPQLPKFTSGYSRKLISVILSKFA